MAYTLEFEIAGDPTGTGHTGTATFSIVVDGVTTSLGTKTTPTDTVTGYQWGANSFDVSATFDPAATSVEVRWTAILDYRTAPWTPDVNGRLAQMHLRRGRSSPAVAGDISGDLHVAFIVNGVTLDEGIIYDGYEEGVMGGTGVAFGAGDKLELQPTTVPAGTKSLTARVTQTHYH